MMRASPTNSSGGVQLLSRFQAFWDVMDDFDAHTAVLEPAPPAKPPRALPVRRLALGKHCSAQITVLPDAPRGVCECRFMGADASVLPLHNRLSARLGEWRVERLPRENLQAVLELTFPQPVVALPSGDARREDLSVECGICYAYRTEAGALPDRNCENASCGRPFHRWCLTEWLRSVTSTRVSFSTLFGACPYCSHPLSVALR